MLDAASIQKGDDIPHQAMTKPVSAGPTARLTLMPALFNATAGERSSGPTS